MIWIISTFATEKMIQTITDVIIGWHDSRKLVAAALMRPETLQSVNLVNLGSPVPSLTRHGAICAARPATLYHSHSHGVWCSWCLATDPAHMAKQE